MSENQTTVPTWKQFNRPWYQKLGLAIWNYLKGVGLLLWSVIKAIPFKIWAGIKAIGRGFQGLWFRFIHGDWRTKISYLIMGFGNFTRSPKQIVKGLLLLAVEAIYVVFMFFIGVPNVGVLFATGQTGQDAGLSSIGRVPYEEIEVGGVFQSVEHDNSLKILIFSVMTVILTIFFVYMWVKNTKIAYNTQKTVEAGKPLTTMKQQISYVLNDGYHTTILALPVIGILLITVLPLVCNIIIAFTNYGKAGGMTFHGPPASLINWVGFATFAKVFGTSYGSVIWNVLAWTLIWAFFATFTNFFFGMFLAMIINKKSIKMKAFWRTCFILVIAIPDFVTLLMMSRFFGYSADPNLTGPMNMILREWFNLDVNIDWLKGSDMNARVMVIVINMWRGMPYTMLATSGILMNIPEELYESSRIDGAGPVRRFISITFPYIMFVMGPQLITTFTGNINNFNVIFFLTGGEPTRLGWNGAGSTDLLVTWLYKLTISAGNEEYCAGAVIGIFTFLITAFFALIVFNSSKSIKQEDTFQ